MPFAAANFSFLRTRTLRRCALSGRDVRLWKRCNGSPLAYGTLFLSRRFNSRASTLTVVKCKDNTRTNRSGKPTHQVE